MPPSAPFFLFFSFISLKNFNHHGLRNRFPFVNPCGIWSVLDELWRILRSARTRSPRRFCMEGNIPAANSEYAAYWFTVLVPLRFLDFPRKPVHHVTSVSSQCDPALYVFDPLSSETLPSSWPRHPRDPVHGLVNDLGFVFPAYGLKSNTS